MGLEHLLLSATDRDQLGFGLPLSQP